jgi:hypothetical protein
MRAHNDTKQGRKQYGNVRDEIFYYTKSNDDWTWNSIYTPYSEEYVRDRLELTPNHVPVTIIVIAEVPVTAGGKPDKRALAELALERARAARTSQAAW